MPAKVSKNVLLSVGVMSLAFIMSGCNSENAQASPKTAVQAQKSASKEITPEFIDMVSKKFAGVRAELKVDKIEKTEVDGIYQVFFDGKGSVYMAASGDYFFSGDLLAIRGNQVVNVTDEKSNGPRAELISKIDPKEMIIFPAKGKKKASVTVFTDVDCGYCRKLHQEVPAMNEKGIEIRYLAYPRAGIGSPSYQKIASAWCADDPNKALSTLKNGGDVAMNVCEDNPVADQYNAGLQAGLSGTPALVLESGQLIPGYMTADQLAQTLGI